MLRPYLMAKFSPIIVGKVSEKKHGGYAALNLGAAKISLPMMMTEMGALKASDIIKGFAISAAIDSAGVATPGVYQICWWN